MPKAPRAKVQSPGQVHCRLTWCKSNRSKQTHPTAPSLQAGQTKTCALENMVLSGQLYFNAILNILAECTISVA
jgi:hypothetical protein